VHGDVALFVKSDYSLCIGYDLTIDNIENICMETLEMILGAIYN